MSIPTLRRQRRRPLAFVSPHLSPFLLPSPTSWSTPHIHRSTRTSPLPRPVLPLVISANAAVKTKPRRATSATKPRTRSSPTSVAAPSRRLTNRPPQQSSYSKPVPAPLPHEIEHPRRGRNARRRVREAEHFRRYIYLRRQLKPWSDAFRARHGRTPSLIDVHASDIPGLLDRFAEYLDALEGIRFDVQTVEN